MEYEVVIDKHWSGNTYNVQLNAYERNGYGVSHGRAFDVSYKEATKVAEKQSSIYGAKITNKTGRK